MKLAVVCPHFAPDIAPTGEVMTRIVHELAARGHELHVVSALPWYQHHRVEPGWEGCWVRRERTEWGSVTRIHPFPGPDKRSIPRRALGFAGFTGLATIAGLRGGRVDGVLAMSPPLTLGLSGWMMGLVRRGPLVFNIQDVFPDAAIETRAITNRHVIRVAKWLEVFSYRRSAAVTVLSADLRDNLVGKLGPSGAQRVRVIPNFVDTEAIRPLDRMTPYRRELGIGDEPVVMYAGNVGFSQSLGMMLDAARRFPQATFLINGGGSALQQLRHDAADWPNIRFGEYQPRQRLAEVLATGDIHVVPLKAGLARVSVPSKTYSVLAAGRPIVAAIDEGTEVARIVTSAGCGEAVAPDDSAAFAGAIGRLLHDPVETAARGRRGREWVERWASPAAIAEAYERLFAELR